MKNFMFKLFSNKIFLGFLGIVIAFLFIFQEKCLGDLSANVFIGSPFISLISGLFVEGAFCIIHPTKKYDFWNVISWLAGGILCSLILTLVW